MFEALALVVKVSKDLSAIPVSAELLRNGINNEGFTDVLTRAQRAHQEAEKAERKKLLMDAIANVTRKSKGKKELSGKEASEMYLTLFNVAKSSFVTHEDKDDESFEQLKSLGPVLQRAVVAELGHAFAKCLQNPNAAAMHKSSAITVLELLRMVVDPCVDVLARHCQLADAVEEVEKILEPSEIVKHSVNEVTKLGSSLVTALEDSERSLLQIKTTRCDSATSPLQTFASRVYCVLDKLKLQVTDAAGVAVAEASQKISNIKGGTPGGSWKQSLSTTEAITWKDVVQAASPLIDGVTAQLVPGLKALKEDHLTNKRK